MTRRSFIGCASAALMASLATGEGKASLAMGAGGASLAMAGAPGRRIGVIGLDSSHSLAFAKAFNAADAAPAFRGYKIVSAYPYGSRMIPGAGEKIAANSVA
ncbi:MAG: hypothetical protein JST42_31125, partial [Bacteroidetes bacterium]|nr:hypothetical protein [Bacteroidota bacterium]